MAMNRSNEKMGSGRWDGRKTHLTHSFKFLTPSLNMFSSPTPSHASTHHKNVSCYVKIL